MLPGSWKARSLVHVTLMLFPQILSLHGPLITTISQAAVMKANWVMKNWQHCKAPAGIGIHLFVGVLAPYNCFCTNYTQSFTHQNVSMHCSTKNLKLQKRFADEHCIITNVCHPSAKFTKIINAHQCSSVHSHPTHSLSHAPLQFKSTNSISTVVFTPSIVGSTLINVCIKWNYEPIRPTEPSICIRSKL